MIIGEHIRGGFAKYVVAPAKNLVTMPDNVDFPEACAPLLVTLTAWRMLINRAKLQAGETVLVVGAGGGVNSWPYRSPNWLGPRSMWLRATPKKRKKPANWAPIS